MEQDKSYELVNAHTGAVVLTGLKSVDEAAKRIKLVKFHDPELGKILVIRRAE